MEFRTKVKIEPSPSKISYNDRVMFIGSCFASSIGSQMALGRMLVKINPTGTVYNPFSVSNTIDIVTQRKEFGPDDLYCHDGNYLSFYHYTDFSSDDKVEVLNEINRASKEALAFLQSSGFLFITFGTARVYRWKKTGVIVSNCHKIPEDQFSRELLSVSEIVEVWKAQLSRLEKVFPQLKVVFTISPVRHWKDGAHGNQVSKSVLFLAVEELLSSCKSAHYFPAYELLMDDLRDYRFYNDDMLHPSVTAINYIWDAFSACYMDRVTLDLWKDVYKITKACTHRLSSRGLKVNVFAERMIKNIADIEKKEPSIDLSEERDYFKSLL